MPPPSPAPSSPPPSPPSPPSSPPPPACEHPAVFRTSAPTASDHAPLMSCKATQKNAPPLQANSPSYTVLRSAVTVTARFESVLEPVPEQSAMQWPNTTLVGSPSNMSLLRLRNISAPLACPSQLDSTPFAGLVT